MSHPCIKLICGTSINNLYLYHEFQKTYGANYRWNYSTYVLQSYRLGFFASQWSSKMSWEIRGRSIEKYHRADMRRSLGMNIFCQKNSISACKMWFFEYKCTNYSRNSKYTCTLHPNIMADPRHTY